MNTDQLVTTPSPFKGDETGGCGEKCIIFANPDIEARIKFCTSLPNEDVACQHMLTSKTLHAQTLGIGITIIAA